LLIISSYFSNTGDNTFPFSRISGATPVGTVSPFTVVTVDQSVLWVGNNLQGTGIVYQAQGFTPVRISTEAIELRLQQEPYPGSLRAWTYQQEGHVFYVITGGSLETSLVYDLTTKMWHERSFLESTGALSQHLGACSMYAFDKQLVGDRVEGKIYTLSQDIYSDNGSPIQRKRVYTHLINELNYIRLKELQIGFEVGVGTTSGTGSDPMCSLRISKDGGKTYGSFYNASIGKIGRYNQQVKF